MTPLYLFNTLASKKQPFLYPSGRVTLYVCGITAYDHCHLGHARSAIIFDAIRNYLEYKGLTVCYVKNFTDIDDKIIHRAAAEQRPWKEVAEQFIASYNADMARLGVRPPTVSPKATDHIPRMIQIIEKLVATGAAYVIEGDVYFEVSTAISYGILSRKKPEQLLAGARVEIDERKRNPLDFALWKASKPGEPVWDSPWGPGRPGWHIECSAMAMEYLGETVDIHGGGSDLIFPHHENEIVQSETYTGKPFVSCFIHHGFVTIADEKMSKSLGNFLFIRDIFEQFAHFPEAVFGEVLRFYLLSVHYRSAIDFSSDNLRSAKQGLDNLYTLLQRLDETQSLSQPAPPGLDDVLASYEAKWEAAMDDDFNTPEALAVMQTLRAYINTRLSAGDAVYFVRALFVRWGAVLGLLQVSPEVWRYDGWLSPLVECISEATVQAWIAEREAARGRRDWATSDAIRKRLAETGIVIEDRPDGTTRIKR